MEDQGMVNFWRVTLRRLEGVKPFSAEVKSAAVRVRVGVWDGLGLDVMLRIRHSERARETRRRRSPGI
jgi:hypothetical protein